MNRDPRLLYGADIRKRILDEVAADISRFATRRKVGRLVSVGIGEVEEIAVYIRGQARAAAAVGLPFDEQHWPADLTQDECKARLVAMNDDPDVLGVILQRPVPDHINVRSLQSAIHPLKDVEGMNPASIGNIVYNQMALAPCTAAASVEMIRATGMKIEGMEVVVVGHSEIVGKPAAFMLMAEGATVTVCHYMTRSVAAHTRRADVVIVAVGVPGLLTADMVKHGAAVIDIGINQVTDADGSSRIVGDADTGAVADIASWTTPVPGGVGPVTVAMLMRNAAIAFETLAPLLLLAPAHLASVPFAASGLAFHYGIALLQNIDFVSWWSPAYAFLLADPAAWADGALFACPADASLERLGVDHIDLYYAHTDDAETPIAETLGAFGQLVDAGKVRHIAASNFSAARLRESIVVAEEEGLPRYVAHQPHYNLLERDVEESVIPATQDLGLATFPYFSLASGFLTGKHRHGDAAGSARVSRVQKYADPRGERMLAAMDTVAESRSSSLATIALAWLAQRPTVASPIASARTVDQLPDLLALADLELTAEEMALLEQV